MEKNQKLKKYTGQVFNFLTAVEFKFRSSDYKQHWLFYCKCGKQKVIGLSEVIHGHIKSCGCLKKGRLKDYTGLRAGKLIAIKYIKRVNRASFWLFKCDCGNFKEISASAVFIKNTLSCGCSPYHLPEGEAKFNRIFGQYKRVSLKKKRKFELTKDQFRYLIISKCFYCGAEPTLKLEAKQYGGYKCNGIDRIDSLKGYILENCVSCCRRCNFSKNNMSIMEFKEMICKIYKNLRLENV